MPAIWCLTDERYLAQRMPGAAVDWLRARGHDVRVLVVDHETVRVDGARISSPWDAVAEGDLVVSRSRHPLALALLDAAGRRRARVVTPWAGVAAVRNKARCADLLALHGLPVPETHLAASVDALAGLDRFPLVLKPHLGDNGDGVTLVRSPQDLRRLAWDDGLVLAQRWVDTGGWDVKLYVCGDRTWAVRRPSPLVAHPPGPPQPHPLTAELRWIARTCRDAFELPLCGVDVAAAAEGALVVDVNDFPNYTGVAGAAEAVGRLLETWLAPEREPVGGRRCAS
jgi:ribosomal protein S6--L-glutamate ligase